MAIPTGMRTVARVSFVWLVMVAIGMTVAACSLEDTELSHTGPSRQLLATKAYRHKLHRIHGWLLCLAWGFFIPAGIVVAAFRTVTKLGSAWWYYVHVSFQIIGFLLSLAGIAVGCYFPADDKLMVQHKIIGIVVNVVAGLQVIAGMAARPPKTAMLRRYWNLAHWTIGRAVLLLAIANIFIGMYLSHIAYSHQIAQAVVLGGLLIIYMLKNTIDYLLVRHTPAEEERLLAEMQHKGGNKYNVEMSDAMYARKPSNGHINGTNGLRTIV